LYWTEDSDEFPERSPDVTVNVWKPTVLVSNGSPLSTVPSQEVAPDIASRQL
jgi:hypothetical protein